MSNTTNTASLTATKKAQRAPSKAKVPRPMEAVTAALTQQAAPEAPAPVKTVALRGGMVLQRVKLTDKTYRVGCEHNANWFKQVQAACKDGDAAVADLVAAGVPTPFIGYIVRRGYLTAA